MFIRAYRASDLDTLKRITVEAFDGVSIDHNLERAFGPIAGHDWRWRKARHIDDDVTAAGALTWVAEDEAGEVVGYIGLRGQGVGRQLIEYALERFREAGLEVARIETLEQNPVGRHLYPACGFVEVARQVHFALRLTSDAGPGDVSSR